MFADAHCGHKLGLLNPETVLVGSEGLWTPGLTEVQRYLWSWLEKCRADLLDRLRGKQRVILVHDGDLGQGSAFPHTLVSIEPKDQVMIAAAMLRPWLNIPNVVALRIMAGTDAHSMGASSIEVLVAEMLTREYPNTDVQVRWHVRLRVDGVLFDVAHHGPMAGSRTWLRGNVARAYLRDRMEHDFRRGYAVPRMYVRAHAHDFLYIEDELEGVPGGCRSGLLLLPSFCGLSDHGRKATQSAPELVTGMVFADVRDGLLVDVHPMVQRLDLRTAEEL
jgi:hypothetical protein